MEDKASLLFCFLKIPLRKTCVSGRGAHANIGLLSIFLKSHKILMPKKTSAYFQASFGSFSHCAKGVVCLSQLVFAFNTRTLANESEVDAISFVSGDGKEKKSTVWEVVKTHVIVEM